MLKNISSMNKKNDNELLEIPDFLKKLSTDEKDDVRPKIEEPSSTKKITPITEVKVEPKVIKSKPKVDIKTPIDPTMLISSAYILFVPQAIR